jgi:hypothetical protein
MLMENGDWLRITPFLIEVMLRNKAIKFAPFGRPTLACAVYCCLSKNVVANFWCEII